MINRVLPISINTKSKIKIEKMTSKMYYFLAFILAFVLGKAMIMGQVMPYGVAFTVSILLYYREFIWPTILGTILGIWFSTQGLESISYILEVGLVCILFKRQVISQKKQWLAFPILIAAVNLLVRGTYVFFWANDPYQWVVVIFESIFTALLTVVSLSSLTALRKAYQESYLSLEEKVSIVLMAMGVIIGLKTVYIGDLSIQSMVCRWLVLIGGFAGGPGAGAAVGVIVGMIPNLMGQFSANSISFYALSGLVGGVFYSFKRLGVLIGFTLGNLLLSLYFGQQDIIVTALLETVIAGIVFLIFVPQNILVLLRGSHPFEDEAKPYISQVEIYGVEKLKKLGDIFISLSKSFSQPNEIIEDTDLSKLIDTVGLKVCEKCSMKKICWEQDFHKTYRSFLEACTKLEFGKNIEEKDFGIDLQRRCGRLRELGLVLNSQLELYRFRREFGEKIEKTKDLVSNQLLGLSDIVMNLVRELEVRVNYDESLGNYIKKQFEQKGINVKTVSVMEINNREKEIIIEQERCIDLQFCKTLILPNIVQIMGQPYTIKEKKCSVNNGKNGCIYHLIPSSLYDITVGLSIAAKNGASVSGDHLSTIDIPNQRFAMMLSDGMGHGINAQKESQTAIELLESLLDAGIDHKTAVEAVNSVLLLRSQEERFATLDLAIIDKVNGKLDIAKIGAAPTLIKSGKNVKIINSSSPPIGILQTVNVELQKVNLVPGDIVILLSDGVWEAFNQAQAEEGWIIEVLQKINTSSPQQVADHMMYLATQATGGIPSDDFSILVGSIDYKDTMH